MKSKKFSMRTNQDRTESSSEEESGIENNSYFLTVMSEENHRKTYNKESVNRPTIQLKNDLGIENISIVENLTDINSTLNLIKINSTLFEGIPRKMSDPTENISNEKHQDILDKIEQNFDKEKKEIFIQNFTNIINKNENIHNSNENLHRKPSVSFKNNSSPKSSSRISNFFEKHKKLIRQASFNNKTLNADLNLVNFFPLLGSHNHFETEINIVSYIIKNVFLRHVDYVIAINNIKTKNNYKIIRRYSEFYSLRMLLVNQYIGMYIPSLPEKKFFGNRDINLIEYRKKFLQLFVHELQLCYFFKESPIISCFFNPLISHFPPTTCLQININNILNTLDVPELESILKILRKTFNIHINKKCDDRLIISMEEIKPKYLIEIIQKLKNFNIKIGKNKTNLGNILIVIEKILISFKECDSLENEFLTHLIKFEENIFTMNDKINVLFYNSEKNLNDTKHKLDDTITNLSKNKARIKNLKNIEDWISKEILNHQIMFDLINSIFPFIYKLIEVEKNLNEEIQKASSNYFNFEVKQRYENSKSIIKEIIVLMCSYIYNIELEKFKSFRFEYFYNSLKFYIVNNNIYNKNKRELENELDDMLEIMKRYLRNIKQENILELE